MPARKHKTGQIFAIVLIAVLLCAALSVGGYFAWKAWSAKDKTPVTPTEQQDEPGADTPDGYATAEEAVRAELEEAGYGDWVYQLYEEDADQVTYWAGPPQSEYVEEIVAVRNSDGSWSVTEVSPLDFGDVSDGGGGQGEAASIVSQFLYAVQDDRGEDAHALTVEPFSSDAASAEVSAGGLETFDVVGAVSEGDAWWVRTTQVWYGEAQRWQYRVVPTEAGYAIADVKPW